MLPVCVVSPYRLCFDNGIICQLEYFSLVFNHLNNTLQTVTELLALKRIINQRNITMLTMLRRLSEGTYESLP